MSTVMKDAYPKFSDEERWAFVARWVIKRKGFKEIIFKKAEFTRFFGIRLALRLQNVFGGVRFRPVEKDIRVKIPIRKWDENAPEPPEKISEVRKEWRDIGRKHLEEICGEKGTELIFKYLTGVYIYVPAGSLKSKHYRNWQIEKVLSMLDERIKQMSIAKEMGKSDAWVSWVKKTYR